MRPPITVLMTVFNPDAVFLRHAVVSILEQTWSNFEFVIVEDPSASCGREIIFSLRDSRVRYVLNKHRTSLVLQKNQGIAMSRGQFIAMMDADDVAAPTRLETQLSAFKAAPELGVIGSNVEVIDEAGRRCGVRRFPGEHVQIIDAMQAIVPLCHPATMIRRECLQVVRGYEDNGFPIEDYDLWSRLAERGCCFRNRPECLLQYRVHSGQVKYRRMHDCIRGVLAVKRKFWLHRMSLSARVRMHLEQALLWLPASLVYSLLMRIYYREVGYSTAPTYSSEAFVEGDGSAEVPVTRQPASTTARLAV